MRPPATLYELPGAPRDLTRAVWPAIGAFFLITLFACGLATEYTAWRFGWSSDLGAPWWPHVYPPFEVIAWSLHFDHPAEGQAVLDTFEIAHLVMALGALVALVIPVTLIYRRTRKGRPVRNDLYGSAHFADAAELAATGLLHEERGVYLGALADSHGGVRYLRHDGPEHILAFAPTRSGKGVGLVVPSLLGWKESVLVHDIKGENFHLTAGYRARVLHQRVIRFSPSERGSARFNPLREIRLATDHETQDVQNLATMIVDPDGKGLNDHWSKTGFDLLVGCITHVLYAGPDKTLAGVYQLLTDPHQKYTDLMEALCVFNHARGLTTNPWLQHWFVRADGTPLAETEQAAVAAQLMRAWGGAEGATTTHPVVARSARAMVNKAPNESSGVLSTTLSFLSLYKDPIVAANVAESDFAIEDLMRAATSLYLVVPPSDKDRLKPLVRLMINQVVRRLTEGMAFDPQGRGHSLYPHRLLLMLDEFPSLGKLDIFQESLAFMAGYGIKAFLITQDLSQLYAAYTKDESILSNCHIRIAFAPNKLETADLLSKMTGVTSVTQTTRQYSGSRLAVLLGHVMTNDQTVQRSLLTPDETMRLPDTDALLFVAGHPVIYCQKIRYYEDPVFAARAALSPA